MSTIKADNISPVGSNIINYQTVSGSVILDLAAGDVISVFYRGSPYSAGYSNFNGYCIG